MKKTIPYNQPYKLTIISNSTFDTCVEVFPLKIFCQIFQYLKTFHSELALSLQKITIIFRFFLQHYFIICRLYFITFITFAWWSFYFNFGDPIFLGIVWETHGVKGVRIRSYSGPHFSRIFPHSDWIFGLNSVSLRI